MSWAVKMPDPGGVCAHIEVVGGLAIFALCSWFLKSQPWNITICCSSAGVGSVVDCRRLRVACRLRLNRSGSRPSHRSVVRKPTFVVGSGRRYKDTAPVVPAVVGMADKPVVGFVVQL